MSQNPFVGTHQPDAERGDDGLHHPHHPAPQRRGTAPAGVVASWYAVKAK